MRYRYGDATPFPLDENFIDTIVAATDACVALFEADMHAAERRRHADRVKTQAAEEIKRLSVLEKAVAAAVAPMKPNGRAERVSQAAAAKIAHSAHTQIKHAHAQVTKRRDAAIRAAIGEELPLRIRDAMEKFLLAFQLPQTRWAIAWQGGSQAGEARVRARSSSAGDLHAAFDIGLPPDTAWNGPLRVSELDDDFYLRLKLGGGLLSRSSERIERMWLTEAEVSADRDWFVVRRSAKKPAPGYEIVMRSPDQSVPILYAIDERGERQGKAMTVDGDGAVALASLWNIIERGLRATLGHRSHLADARLGDRAVTAIDEPAELAEAILMTLAPIVRQMRLRSKVPGELVLKRDLGDGRREELFVPRQELEARFSRLPYKYRASFEAAGIGGEATREFVSRKVEVSAVASTGDDDETNAAA